MTANATAGDEERAADDAPQSEDEKQQGLNALARKIRGRFLVPPDCDVLLSSYQKVLARCAEPYDAIGQAFQSNVQGLVSTVSIPVTLANVATTNRHFQRVHSAERIVSDRCF
jgi:hypothetical protein